MPHDLQHRLECQADKQGVSFNQLINYFLTIQLTQLETLSALETRLTQKTLPDLKAKVSAILDRVPGPGGARLGCSRHKPSCNARSTPPNGRLIGWCYDLYCLTEEEIEIIEKNRERKIFYDECVSRF